MKLEDYTLEKFIQKGAFGDSYLTSLKDDPKKISYKAIT